MAKPATHVLYISLPRRKYLGRYRLLFRAFQFLHSLCQPMARAMSQNCSARRFELVQSTELVSHWGDNVRRLSALGAQSLADANVGVTGQALNCRKCAQSTM